MIWRVLLSPDATALKLRMSGTTFTLHAGGTRPLPTSNRSYCASKGAVRLLTKSVAVECGQLKLGIRCNSIHPGLVGTNMGRDLLQHFVDLQLVPDAAAATAAFEGAHPIGRMGSPDDIASAALYLASDAAKWVTGAEFVIDGGYTAI